MPKCVQIIGNCPYCDRDVSDDFRPINEMDDDTMYAIQMDQTGAVNTGSIKKTAKRSRKSQVTGTKSEVSKRSKRSHVAAKKSVVSKRTKKSRVTAKKSEANISPKKSQTTVNLSEEQLTQKETDSMSNFKTTILNLIKEEFERPITEKEIGTASKDNAEAIMAMLVEEELANNENTNRHQVCDKSMPKRRKR